MSSEGTRLEIGHVLFIDIVGYSKLLLKQQSELLRELNEIVSGTNEFRQADSAGKLIRLPTGDGMALVFRANPEAPAQCAVEIARALKSHPAIQLRMGIHSGPVNEVVDVNQRANIAGAGINMAQRVMDCADAGHILLSRHVAEDLEQDDRWRPLLHDLGTCEVKHGMRVGVSNLYSDEVGNPQLPKKFQALHKHRAHVRWAAVTIGLLVLGVIIGAAFFFSRRPARSAPAIAEKSIAVLPFENLSRDPENVYFADGIQEEILARLSKIADLKVISRTSTQRYKSAPENLPQIAKQLGVAHVLEGTVQKAADEVRVNVQLINAEADSQLWADKFDRKLTDIFAVESEIAAKIADTLQATLTDPEKHAISARPTDDPVAYEFYLKGRYFWNKRTGNDFKTAIIYFQKAIDNDPGYALAYAGLADTYVLLPAFTWAAPQDSLPKAKAASEKALELDNSLSEAHTSLGMVLRAYDFDYRQALVEFRRAIELNPNYAPAHYWLGAHVLSALGRFDESIAEAKRALELDPLSLVANADLGVAYYYARRFDDAVAQVRKGVELDENFYYARATLGQALECNGQIDAAISELEKAHELSDDPFVSGLLGHACAKGGRRDDALKILLQLKDESTRHYVPPYAFAIIHLGLGDKAEAVRWLEKDFSDRDGWNIGFVRVDPNLDPLRGDARFEALANKVVPESQFKSATESKMNSRALAALKRPTQIVNSPAPKAQRP